MITSEQLKKLLLEGHPPDTCIGVAISSGASAGDAAKMVSDMRKKMAGEADCSRPEQVGLAISQLKDLYKKGMMKSDYSTAMQARKELNRLMQLYGDVEKNDDSTGFNLSVAEKKIEMISNYILPLKLCGEQFPVEEHVRIAAELIRINGIGGVPK
jgi:hypothetical protein